MSEFTNRLINQEHLLWTGRPRQGIRFSNRDIIFIPFSLFWGGFAIMWETGVVMTKAPWFFKFWGIPFVVIGLFMIAGRFFLDAWLRARIEYAVTSQRILIDRRGLFSQFIALQRGQLPNLEFKSEAQGRGTIRFGAQIGRNQPFTGAVPALDPVPQFIGIENAEMVFNLIQDQRS